VLSAINRWREQSAQEVTRRGASPRFENMMPVNTPWGELWVDPMGLISITPVVRGPKEVEEEDKPTGWRRGVYDVIGGLGAVGISPGPVLSAALQKSGVLTQYPASDIFAETKLMRAFTGWDPEAFIKEWVGGEDWVLDYYTALRLDRQVEAEEISRLQAQQAKLAKSGDLWETALQETRKEKGKESALAMLIPARFKYLSPEEKSIREAQTMYFVLGDALEQSQSAAEKDKLKEARKALLIEHPGLQSYWDTLHRDTLPETARYTEYATKRDAIYQKYDAQLRKLEQENAPERTIEQARDARDKELEPLYDEYEDVFNQFDQDPIGSVARQWGELIGAGRYEEADALVAQLKARQGQEETTGVTYDQFMQYRGRNDTGQEAMRRVLRDELMDGVWDILTDKSLDNSTKNAAKRAFDATPKEQVIERVLQLHPEWQGDEAILANLQAFEMPTFEEMARVGDTPVEALRAELMDTIVTKADGTPRSKAEQYKVQDLYGDALTDAVYQSDYDWIGEHMDEAKAALAQLGRLDELIQQGFTELAEPGYVAPTEEVEPETALGVSPSAAFASDVNAAISQMAEDKFSAEDWDIYERQRDGFRAGVKGSYTGAAKEVNEFIKEQRSKWGLKWSDELEGYDTSVAVPDWYEAGMGVGAMAEKLGESKPTAGGKAPTTTAKAPTGATAKKTTTYVPKATTYTPKTTTKATAYTPKATTYTPKAEISAQAEGWLGYEGILGADIMKELDRFFSGDAILSVSAWELIQALAEQFGGGKDAVEWLADLIRAWVEYMMETGQEDRVHRAETKLSPELQGI